MDSLEPKINHERHESKISQIIQTALIDLYGTNGYKSIIQTMTKESGRSEEEITGNYDIFADKVQGIFGRLGNSKILDPIKMEIDRIKNNQTGHITTTKQTTNTKSTRLLIADDEPHLLELYQDWLKFDNRRVITAENGLKCIEIYKKEYEHSKLNQLNNYFDVVVLDHNMPELNGVQTAVEILKINPNQRIIFASGYVEKILSESLTKINKAIEIIKKPFSVEALDDMINNKTLLDKFEEINSNDKECISTKYTNAISILNNYHRR